MAAALQAKKECSEISNTLTEKKSPTQNSIFMQFFFKSKGRRNTLSDKQTIMESTASKLALQELSEYLQKEKISVGHLELHK